MASVSAAVIDREKTWDPHVFCGRTASLVSDLASSIEIGGGIRILEGLRWGILASDVPIFRASNVHELELQVDSAHCQTPNVSVPQCIRPGDVIVTKMRPISAAVVPETMFRHPIDANCFLIRGLCASTAFWLALCLNQPAFGEYLVRKSGTAIVPRVSADSLKTLRLPIQPQDADRISRWASELCQQRLSLRLELFGILSEVHATVAPQLPNDSSDRISSRQPWFLRFKAIDVEDSLVPRQVDLHSMQQRLIRDAGWQSICGIIDDKPSGGERIKDLNECVRTLRLSDVSDDLTVLRSRFRVDTSASRRVYSEPLHLDEVLLSALVSSSRVVFLGYQPAQPIFPTDHWFRLRFRETSGAWAAVLCMPEIQSQLMRLANGTLQQFAPPSTIRKLVLPDIPLEIRLKWDSRLRDWQKRRLDNERLWLSLVAESFGLLGNIGWNSREWIEAPKSLDGWELLS
jgi:hypothetical protein